MNHSNVIDVAGDEQSTLLSKVMLRELPFDLRGQTSVNENNIKLRIQGEVSPLVDQIVFIFIFILVKGVIYSCFGE